MNEGQYIKRAWPKLIEATGNPLAPIVLQAAHDKATALGKMLAQSPRVDKQLVASYSNQLLEWIEGKEDQAARPEFVIVLAAMLTQAIVEYTKGVVK